MLDCETSELDGQFVFVTCAETKLDGIISGCQPDSALAWWREHLAAHTQLDRDRARAEAAYQARMSALHIYRTTEPGHPARNGIGAYLNYAY